MCGAARMATETLLVSRKPTASSPSSPNPPPPYSAASACSPCCAAAGTNMTAARRLQLCTQAPASPNDPTGAFLEPKSRNPYRNSNLNFQPIAMIHPEHENGHDQKV